MNKESNSQKNTFNPLTLEYKDKSVERFYRKTVTQNTLLFNRITWLIIPLLGGVFAFLDNALAIALVPPILLTIQSSHKSATPRACV